MGEQKYFSLRAEQDSSEEDFTRDIQDADNGRTSTLVMWSKTSLLIFSVAIIFGSLGFGLGQFYHPRGKDVSVISVETIMKSFVYNRTFAEAPSEITDAAWESIFPPHGGFFHDPSIAPEGASLAVYHQLHCVDGIRHAYWALHDALIEGRNLTFEELPDYSSPWHTRHCLDFLRQMLMCNADTTIEHNDPRLHGIVGFGINHKCKNWDQIFQWTVDRQTKNS